MAYDQSAAPEGFRRHNVPGLTLNVKNTADAVYIRWDNESASKYSILRGFKKSGGLTNIEDPDFLILDTHESRGEMVDRLEKGITYAYFFRCYLSYVPGSIADPAISKNIDMMNKVTDEMRKNDQQGIRIMNGKKMIRVDGGLRSLINLMKYGETCTYREATPEEIKRLDKERKELDNNENASLDLFSGLLATYIMTQKDNSDSSPFVKSIGGLVSDKNIDLLNNLKACAAPHYISFQAHWSEEKKDDVLSRTKRTIDEMVRKEEVKWNVVGDLELQLKQKLHDVVVSDLQEEEKSAKFKMIHDSYQELIYKIHNL